MKEYKRAKKPPSPSSSRFTDDDIRDIRREFNNGLPQHELARKYNVERQAIYKIVRYKTFKHIK